SSHSPTPDELAAVLLLTGGGCDLSREHRSHSGRVHPDGACGSMVCRRSCCSLTLFIQWRGVSRNVTAAFSRTDWICPSDDLLAGTFAACIAGFGGRRIP